MGEQEDTAVAEATATMQQLVQEVKKQNGLLLTQLEEQRKTTSRLVLLLLLVAVVVAVSCFAVWRVEDTRDTLVNVERSGATLAEAQRKTSADVLVLQRSVSDNTAAVTRVAEDAPKVSVDEKGKLQVQVSMDAKAAKVAKRRPPVAVSVGEEPPPPPPPLPTKANLPLDPDLLEERP